MRILFFGTPEFAVPSLNALLQTGEEVIAVVTQTDKKKGRGHLLSYSPVKEFALKKKLKVLQPVRIKEPLFLSEISDLKPDLIVVVAYGKILPLQILKAASHGCINVHASLLPLYRGAAPIQWSIMNGEKKTGITTMLMDEGLDTGDILLQEEIEITDDDNAETLSKRLSELGASLLIKTIKGIQDGSINPTPQSGPPSYAPPLKKEDGMVDWSKTAKEIYNLIRGMYPWPCAYCYLHGERIKIIKGRVLNGTGIPGRIEKADRGEFIIGTGEGVLSIIELQPEGKSVMTAKAFLQGRKVREGEFFEKLQLG